MDYLLSLVLGFAQGILELLPVSPFGHLAYAGQLFGRGADPLLLYAGGHLGAMAAVSVFLAKDLRMLFLESARILGIGVRKLGNAMLGRDDPAFSGGGGNYRRLALYGLLGCGISLIGMLLLKDAAAALYSSLLFPAGAFCLSGIVLLAASRVAMSGSAVRDIPLKGGILLGVSAALGILPGISALALLVTVSMAWGLSQKAAYRIAYLMRIAPAAVFFLIALVRSVKGGSFGPAVFLEMLLFAVGAFAAVRIFGKRLILRVLKKDPARFAVYSFAAALAGLVLYFIV